MVIKVPKWGISKEGVCTQILEDGVADGFVAVKIEAQEGYKSKES